MAKLILAEGLDDWVWSPTVVDTVRNEAQLSGEELLRVTREVIRELLASGWMMVGDVRPTFVAWSLTIPEALAEIEKRWREVGLEADFVMICWFANTPAGDAKAEQG